MPTEEHELPLEMVRRSPELVPMILQSVFGLDLPGRDYATLTSETFADLDPAELRSDAAVLVDNPKTPSHGVIVEAQTRFNKQKHYTWPAYLAMLRRRYKCGTTLLVICPDQAGARACAAPIDMGHPGWVLKPLTVHPGMLPPITDPGLARRYPELAVLSTAPHSDGPDAEAVLTSVAAAFDVVRRKNDEETGDLGRRYYDYLVRRLSESARKLLEEIVETAGYEWKSDFAKAHRAEGREEGREEGRVQGEATMLLLMLEARGIAVPDEVRERVTNCTDTDQLERWAKRAAVIDNAEDLLD
jgi:hypothetical protein